MSWNGFNGKGGVGQKTPAPRKVHARNTFLRGLIIGAGLALVLGVYLLSSHSHPEITKKAEEGKISKPKPEVKHPTSVQKTEATANEIVMKRDPKGTLRPFVKPKTYRDDKGVLRYKAGGARAPEIDEFKNATPIDTPSNIPRFKYHVEDEIATLLTIEPGGALFGTPHYDKRFEQDFINSLMEPVQINDEDSEQDKQLKREVEATKRDLVERIKAGENLAEIFTQTRDEIRRMAAVKRDIISLAREETSSREMSDEDVRTYYDAVNKMLEDKGLAPVNVNAVMRRRAIYQATNQPEPTM